MDEQGVPIRPPAVAELNVDSRDRYQFPLYGKPSPSVEFFYQSKQPLLAGYFTRIAVSDIQIQWRCPNINTYNNQFAWISKQANNSLLNFYGELDLGFYDVSGIITAITANMNGQEPSLNPGFDTYIGQVIPSATNSNIVTGKIFKNPSAGRGTTYIFDTSGNEYTKFYRTCNTPEGGLRRPGSLNVYFPNITLIGEGATLAYTAYFDIVSNRLSKFSRVKDAMTRRSRNITNVLARVYLTPFNQKERYTGTEPFTFSVDYTTPKHIRWSPEEYLYDFDIALFDEYGELLFWRSDYSTEFQLDIQASET